LSQPGLERLERLDGKTVCLSVQQARLAFSIRSYVRR
jgi:hypothetical protein